MQLTVVNTILVKFIFCITSLVLGASGFEAGTLIKVHSGYKKIEDLSVGDAVCCMKKNNRTGISYVLAIHTVYPKYYTLIQYANGRNLLTALDQLFFTRPHKIDTHFQMTAGNLVPGYYLRCAGKSQDQRVVCCYLCARDEACGGAPPLYLIEIANEHNFLITLDNIVVNSFTPDDMLRQKIQPLGS